MTTAWNDETVTPVIDDIPYAGTVIGVRFKGDNPDRYTYSESETCWCDRGGQQVNKLYWVFPPAEFLG